MYTRGGLALIDERNIPFKKTKINYYDLDQKVEEVGGTLLYDQLNVIYAGYNNKDQLSELRIIPNAHYCNDRKLMRIEFFPEYEGKKITYKQYENIFFEQSNITDHKLRSSTLLDEFKIQSGKLLIIDIWEYSEDYMPLNLVIPCDNGLYEMNKISIVQNKRKKLKYHEVDFVYPCCGSIITLDHVIEKSQSKTDFKGRIKRHPWNIQWLLFRCDHCKKETIIKDSKEIFDMIFYDENKVDFQKYSIEDFEFNIFDRRSEYLCTVVKRLDDKPFSEKKYKTKLKLKDDGKVHKTPW